MINIARLEPSVGFLHEFTGSQTRESLVYDLQEPLRWIGDVTTIEALESGALDMKDFYFTGDDYRYRICIEAKHRFMNLLKEQFNSDTRCNGRVLMWDTVIEHKTNELARCLITGSRFLDFLQPSPEFRRSDGLKTWRKILGLEEGIECV
jgi:CRISPR-associated protein Cas1